MPHLLRGVQPAAAPADPMRDASELTLRGDHVSNVVVMARKEITIRKKETIASLFVRKRR
jgi:hypothetical protein